MKFHSKLAHKIIQLLRIEEYVIHRSKSKPFFIKLIPLHSEYRKGTNKKVIRNKAIFTLDISDYMQWYIWADLDDLSWRKALEYKDGVTIDIGANVGAFTIQLAKNTKDIEIHAFEPNPFIYDKLELNISLNPEIKNRVTINKMGLSSACDTLSFFWEKGNSGGGSFINSSENCTEERIQVITLDQYIIDKQIKQVSFLKIDVEGYEPQVISGASNTIANLKPSVYIEVSPDWWSKSGYKIRDVLQIFEDLSYLFYIVKDENKISLTNLSNVEKIKEQFNLYLVSK